MSRPGDVDLRALVPRTARRVLLLRCPACGSGGLFERYGRLRTACPACGLVLRREQGAQTGSMYLTASVNQVFAAAVLVCVFALTDWSLGVELAVSIPLVVLFCIAFLPFSQTLWAGVEYVTDCINGESWVAGHERPGPRGGPGPT
jgi:uncharacterized protein (DUF983 family)